MSGRYFGNEQVDFNFLSMNIMYNCFKLSNTYLDIQIILLVVKIERKIQDHKTLHRRCL